MKNNVLRSFAANPALVGALVAVLVLLWTASERMSVGLWGFLGLATFFGAMKAHDFVKANARKPPRRP